MSGEILSVHIGGSGIRIGEKLWKKYCNDYGVDYEGKLSGDATAANTYFKSGSAGYRPRAIFADMTTEDLEFVQSFELKNLFNKNLFKSGSKDKGNWASGHYTEGAEIVDTILGDIRIQAEACDNLQGIMLYNSFSGSAGGGLGSLIASQLKRGFNKTPIIGTHIVQDQEMSFISPEVYNTILSLNIVKESEDLSILLNNSQMLKNLTEIKSPSLLDVNDSIVEIPSFINNMDNQNPVSPLFAVDNLAIKNMKFILPSVITSRTPDILESYSTHMFSDNNKLMSYIDLRHGKVLRNHFSYSNFNLGLDIVLKHLEKYRSNNSSYFCSKFKESTYSNYDNKRLEQKSVVSLFNTTAVQEMFKMYTEKFSAMFRRKSFLYHYSGEGMDEMEFTEAESNVNDVISEYQSAQDE